MNEEVDLEELEVFYISLTHPDVHETIQDLKQKLAENNEREEVQYRLSSSLYTSRSKAIKNSLKKKIYEKFWD